MSVSAKISTSNQDPEGLAPEVIDALLRLAGSIRFGSIEIVVHEGRITQIERREKLRLVHNSAQARG